MDFDQLVALVSVAIAVTAFLWEFFVLGGKRLDCRVQMDTPVRDGIRSPYAGVLQNLQRDGQRLRDPSLVVVRIANPGRNQIDSGDYLAPDDDPSGIRVVFRERRVVGAVTHELMPPELHSFFAGDAAGFGFDNDEDAREGVLRLPKVKLPRRARYQVLVVLERWPGHHHDGPDPKPVLRGVAGGQRRRNALLPRLSRRGADGTAPLRHPARVGVNALAVAAVVQALMIILQGFLLYLDDDPMPLDCRGGTLHLHGSTAFAPAVRDAAQQYQEHCPGARIPVDGNTFVGSSAGITKLESAGKTAGLAVGDGLGNHLAFTDGLAVGNHPRLLSRPVAYSVFTLVVNKDAGVENLTLEQVRNLYTGRITKWSEVGGADIPVHLVNRTVGSATRNALVQRVLAGGQPAQPTVSDCAALEPDRPGRCETATTSTMLDVVAQTPGGLGYSEVSSARSTREDTIIHVKIDGQVASLASVQEGTYPFWETEFAYTYGPPHSSSIAAAFLRFLDSAIGQDILRTHEMGSCAQTENPLVC
ncbi:substrate-binding domain-containing protein [Streptomyces coeruleorubidus]|uniref:substrate-binding domain-containing protein n=1 Tax=Streptomyces coeruleorubidus TaxID=116188 RepID=UPI0033AA3E12